MSDKEHDLTLYIEELSRGINKTANILNGLAGPVFQRIIEQKAQIESLQEKIIELQEDREKHCDLLYKQENSLTYRVASLEKQLDNQIKQSDRRFNLVVTIITIMIAVITAIATVVPLFRK